MPYLVEMLPGELPVETGLLLVCKENGTSSAAEKICLTDGESSWTFNPINEGDIFPSFMEI